MHAQNGSGTHCNAGWRAASWIYLTPYRTLEDRLTTQQAGNEANVNALRVVVVRGVRRILVKVGLARSGLGRDLRYMLERSAGLTRFNDPGLHSTNNAAGRALRRDSSVARTADDHARPGVIRLDRESSPV